MINQSLKLKHILRNVHIFICETFKKNRDEKG